MYDRNLVLKNLIVRLRRFERSLLIVDSLSMGQNAGVMERV